MRFKAAGLLHIVGRNGGRKLKKIWQELGVPL
ncbi:tRNA lysidine(34) synthetase TilS [Escherichia sp. TWPC-MK]